MTNLDVVLALPEGTPLDEQTLYRYVAKYCQVPLYDRALLHACVHELIGHGLIEQIDGSYLRATNVTEQTVADIRTQVRKLIEQPPTLTPDEPWRPDPAVVQAIEFEKRAQRPLIKELVEEVLRERGIIA